jgi:hypothetical protein
VERREQSKDPNVPMACAAKLLEMVHSEAAAVYWGWLSRMERAKKGGEE